MRKVRRDQKLKCPIGDFALRFLLYVPRTASLVLVFCIFASAGFAQTDTDISAPPPIRRMSKGERQQLDGETDLKSRTVLTLELMTDRLVKAEKMAQDNQYDPMYTELGGFYALMDDTLRFLIRNNTEEGRALNNLKRFDIGLRALTPRLETMRRTIPENYEPFVRNLIRYVHSAREKAIAPFFSDTVVPNQRN